MARPVTEHERDVLLQHTRNDPIAQDILIRLFRELRELRETVDERQASYNLEIDQDG